MNFVLIILLAAFLAVVIYCFEKYDNRKAKEKFRGVEVKAKENYKEEMRSCLKNILLDLVKSDPEFGNAVVPIISDAELTIRQLPENELKIGMRENHVNAECAALNVLQNCAMYSIKPKSAYDYVSSSIRGEGYENRLFDYVNKLKLEKGYISKEQYDENALLATKLSISSPLGDWF